MSCNICAEEFTKVKRKPIECPYCSFCACTECTARFLLSTDITEPRCMHNDCKKIWSMEFISRNFSKKFYNQDLRNHFANVAFDIQKSQLPSTQPYVEFELQTRKLVADQRDCRDQIQRMVNKLRRLRDHNYALSRAIDDRKWGFVTVDDDKTTQKYNIACPHEDCKGFLNKAWNCSICKTSVCSKCHQIKIDGKHVDGGASESKESDDEGGVVEHVCKEEDIATVELLRKDTKNCPGCGTSIHKIDGCDQMWCTQCKVPFSWRTGRIERGVIHNPHYFQYLRETQGEVPRNPNDNPCGGDIRWHDLEYLNYNIIWTEMLRLKNEITGVHIEACRDYLDNYERIIRDFRVKYCLDEIDDARFRSIIKRESKKREKTDDVLQIYTTFCTGLNDIFQRLVKHNETVRSIDAYLHTRDYKKYFDDCINLIVFVNDLITKSNKRFTNNTPKIHIRFRLAHWQYRQSCCCEKHIRMLNIDLNYIRMSMNIDNCQEGC